MLLPSGPGAAEDEAPISKKRLNELDWFRALMVICVVYAHVSRSGVEGGVDGSVLVDNRVFTEQDPAPFATRWLSEMRQLCLPLLFFVSGAACACSFKLRPRGFSKLAVVTALGMALNATLWMLGPQNPACDPGTWQTNPSCKGVLLNFTICPWSGDIFPTVFQMWYTLMLMLLMLINWPLCAFLKGGSCGLASLFVQWCATCGIAVAFMFGAGEEIPGKALLVGLVLLYEALFLAAAVCTSAAWRPSCIPLRVVHYSLGLLALLQFAATPIVPQIDSMSLAFVLYIFLGFNKFFQLGFVLTLARLPGSDEASPVVSKYWPLVVVLRVVTVPSTNWSIAGNLTYPYFPRMLDRVNYVLGAIVLMFVFDRAGRYISCEPLPTVLATTTLLLYLLHPVLMAFILSIFSNGSWFREANQVWLGSLVLCLALVWSAGAIKQVVSRRRSKKEQEASSSEDEDSET